MKIESGKRYWRRDGSISGVVKANVGDSVYLFKAGSESYRADGTYNKNDLNHPIDLIAEYTGPELVPPGEKVKRTIVFKETLQRFNDYWMLGWESGRYPHIKLVSPDETIYTGNERVVEV